MSQLPKRKPRAGVPKKLKRRHCEKWARTRWQGRKIKTNEKAMSPYSYLWKRWIHSTSIQRLKGEMA